MDNSSENMMLDQYKESVIRSEKLRAATAKIDKKRVKVEAQECDLKRETKLREERYKRYFDKFDA